MISAETGAPLPHAWIRASNGAVATSGAIGDFTFPRVPAGTCSLRVALIGYAPTFVLANIPDTDDAQFVEIALTSTAIPLGEISVQAAPAPRDGAVLSHDQLARISGTGDDVMRAVQTLPGAAAPEISASFLLRGGESDETLVRYDGFDLLEAYHVREWGGSFSVVSIEATERIRLLKGGLPARYGRHLSGVLEIEGPEAVADHTTVDLGVGFSQARAVALIPSGKAQVLIAAHEGLFAPVARTVTFDPNANVVPEFHDVMFTVRRPTGSNGTLNLLALGVLDHVRYDERYKGNDIDSDVQDMVVGLRWSRRSSSGVEYEGVIAFDYLDRLVRIGLNGASDSRVRAVRGRWVTRSPVGEAMAVETEFLGEYEASFLRFDSIDGGITNGVYSERIATSLSGPAIRRRGELSVSWEAKWNSAFSTSAGLNAASDDYGWGVRRDGRPPEARGGATRFSPRIAAAVVASPAVTVRGSAGVLRQPTFLNFLDESRASAPLGRERLAREATLGIDVRPGRFFLRLEGYLRRDRGVGFPVQDLTGHPSGTDLDRGDARGLEILARSPGWRAVDATVAYAWSRATWRAGADDVPRSFDQPHALTATINVRPFGRWNWNTTLRYHTGNAYTRAIWRTGNGGYSWDLDYGPLMGERFSDYLRLDARLSHPLSLGRQASFYVEVLNMTNRSNQYARSWDFTRFGSFSTPRYFFIDLIPIIPFAGVEVRF